MCGLLHNQYQMMSSEFFYNNFSVFGQIRKSLNGQNCFEDIAIN